MTRGTRALDRVATVVVGLLLVAAGLLALDWRFGFTSLAYTDTLSTSAATTALERTWVTWVTGGVGLLLALLGLWWLLAHARRGAPSSRRLTGSTAAGRLEVDLGELAGAVADRTAELGPLERARGRTRKVRGTTTVEVRARLVAGADPDELVRTVEQAAAEVATALPGEPVTCRVLVDAPGRPRAGRSTTVPVR